MASLTGANCSRGIERSSTYNTACIMPGNRNESVVLLTNAPVHLAMGYQYHMDSGFRNLNIGLAQFVHRALKMWFFLVSINWLQWSTEIKAIMSLYENVYSTLTFV